MSFIPGMFPAGAVASQVITPPSISFIGTTADDSDQTTYTYTNHAIGAAAATRRVVAVLHWFGNLASPRTLSSATIQGISATIHVQAAANPATTSCGIAIVSALVPTGTTATIAFTLSGGALRSRIGVYSALNEANTTPTATASDNVTSPTVLDANVNVAQGGWVVAGACFGGTGGTCTWVGATEQYDNASAESAGRQYTGAFASGLTAATPRTVNVTYSVTGDAGVAASMSWS